ncbi:MAG: response regulator transcription factor [Edaphobacter sp.]
MRVLIIEDEKRLAENVAAALRENGIATDLAHDGETGKHLAGYGHYDLVLLDLMLPQADGVTVLKWIRARRDHTPVLVVTAKDDSQSIIDLLNLGADDYLSKPFDLGELMARVKALIRRGKGVATPTVKLRDLEVDTMMRTVSRQGTLLEVSPTEYRILEYLLHKTASIVSKRELLEHLYDFNWERHSNVIEAHISNLRKKLDADTGTSHIQTYRGRGYRLAPEDMAMEP